MRDIDPLIQSELETKNIKTVYLLKGIWESGEVNFTNFIKDLEFNGDVYVAGGQFLSVEGLEETTEFQAVDASITLSGIAPDSIALFTNEEYVGNDAYIYLALLDDTDDIIADPILVFKGQLNDTNFDIDEDNGTASVTVGLTNYLARFDDVGGRLSNDSEQKRYLSNDTCFAQMADLSNKGVEGTF